MEDRIKVGMRVSLEWHETDPELDPRVPVSHRKPTKRIAQGIVLAIASGLAVVQLDDGTTTPPTPLGRLTPVS